MNPWSVKGLKGTVVNPWSVKGLKGTIVNPWLAKGLKGTVVNPCEITFTVPLNLVFKEVYNYRYEEHLKYYENALDCVGLNRKQP